MSGWQSLSTKKGGWGSGWLNGFSPLSWFAAGEQGAWYDPSDLTTLFQDSAGTIPVTAVEQPVGLMLDKSKGLALGAELVTNGTFDTGISGVTSFGGVGISRDTTIFTSGGLKLTAAGPGNSAIYGVISIPTVVGAMYRLSADLYAPATNSVSLSCFLTPTTTAATEGMNISANGVVQNKTCIFTAVVTTTLIKAYIMNHGVAYGTTGDVAYYDNISVKQIAGNHAFQATAGNRPVLSARVNLLTKTEDFSDGIWAKYVVGSIVADQGISPTGTLTADLFSTSTTLSSQGFFYNSVSLLAISYTHVIYVKPIDWFLFSMNNIDGLSTSFNLTTMQTSSGEGGTSTGTITPVGDGWYRLTRTTTATTGTQYPSFIAIPTYPRSGGSLSWTPSQVYTTLVWGADLRPTNSGALLPPYQRVNTASDYDTVGFPLYLKANGTSSAMSTNSIDFTATDKMTVVTGVRKLSDAAKSYLIELSATSDINNGSFALTAPNSAAVNYAWLSKGTIADTLIATTYTAPLNNVVTGLANISGATNTLRVNGIATSDTNTQGTGVYGNYPLYLFTRSATVPTVAYNFYGAIIRGAQSDTASVTQTENYMATKTGITF